MTTTLEGYLDFLQIDFSKIKFSTVKKSYVKNMDISKRFLMDNGIDVNFLDSEGKKIGRNAVAIITGQKSKEFFFDTIEPKIKSIVKRSIDLSIGQQVITQKAKNLLESIAIIASIFVINSMAITLLENVMPPVRAYVLVACLICPITEEYGKRLAVLKGYGYFYTSIFSSVEGFFYINQAINSGMSIPHVIMSRLVVSIIHFYTTMIQQVMHDKGKQNPDSQQSGDGFKLAVLIHFIWNVVASIKFIIL